MNFSAFGGPFSGIHQFAAKFSHNDGAFTSPVQQDNHLNRYHSNTTNHYNQNTSSKFKYGPVQHNSRFYAAIFERVCSYGSHLVGVFIDFKIS